MSTAGTARRTTGVTFGIEEEFVLLDRASLATVDVGLAAVDDLRGSCPGVIVREFFPSQIEFATPVCTDAAEAREAIIGFRRNLSEWADAAGVVPAGSGTPYDSDDRAPALEGRYAEIALDIAGLTPDHQLNGLHVHVGIPDRDAGIRASNALRPWLPVVLALAANSPYWHAHDTGYASWRIIHSRRWTTHGIPPYFGDAAEYDEALARIAGVGATSDPGTINWHARLSANHPTLEIRVCDAQLDAASSTALAVIIRALVVRGFDRETPRPQRFEAWDAALWHAARYGASATIVDPATGHPAPARAVIGSLRELIRPMLAEGDREIVDLFLARVLERGDGAARQLRHGSSVGELGRLYRDSIVEE